MRTPGVPTQRLSSAKCDLQRLRQTDSACVEDGVAVVPTKARSRLIAWDGLELLGINTVRQEKDFLWRESSSNERGSDAICQRPD